MTELWHDHQNQIKEITIDTPFQVGPVNVYLIFSDALILVDTGPKTAEAREQLKAGLRKYGVSFKDLDYLLLTHHHPDHIGLTAEVAESTKVAGHHRLIPWLDPAHHPDFLKQRIAYLDHFYKRHGMDEASASAIVNQNLKYMTYAEVAPLNVPLHDGDRLDGLPGWHVMETLGHAQTHLSLMRDNDQVMVAGDHLIRHISSNALLEPPHEPGGERPRTLLQYREAMKKCLSASKVYSGHGEPVLEPAALIQKRLYEQDQKAAYLKSLIGQEVMTAVGVTRKMYKGLYDRQPGLTFSETLGHLDLLESRLELSVSEEDIWRYAVPQKD
ncbi:MBL fold metallo-hydrolase [Salisediminibacterium beveridgei]|uniref:Metallo-beta-lactamase domain-containing protein n=1 Tax=Salisediminibacterium beveridgei TaxID=632773 RepID=A0A1D7QXG0_9BACI|nr:MBL fold metallo-hydrolase [Salisediminibacterium beveridgei]AOM83690.1 hypothetical protein BBEV_2349 [Salisediminibacterium beveridgei]